MQLTEKSTCVILETDHWKVKPNVTHISNIYVSEKREKSRVKTYITIGY